MDLPMPPEHGTQTGPRPEDLAAPQRAGPLTAEEFAARYRDSWQVLWCAAAGVVRDRTLAQDVVQQAAIVGLERLSDFDRSTNFVSWMVRIVKNIALNEARKRFRRRTSPADTATLDGAPAPARRVPSIAGVIGGRGEILPDQAAFDDEVVQALDHLDDTARACLLLRIVLDLPYRDIALALDIPEGTAASHVHRARKVLRDHLRNRAANGTGSGGKSRQKEQPDDDQSAASMQGDGR